MQPETKMTADEAVTFTRVSPMNMAILVEAAIDRHCTCEPYRDWFTYNRWAAQGFQVNRGEKGTRLLNFIPLFDEEGKKSRMLPKSSVVFCRCQVKPT